MAMSGDFLARIKLALEGKEKVISGLTETQQAAQQLSKIKITTVFDKEGLATGKQIEQTFSNISKEGRKSFQAMGDFEKAIRRVVLVAPVWMAFRTIIQGVLGTISEGFRTWEAFDKQLIKSKAVIHGYSGDVNDALKILEERIRTFSKESGIALDELASSFYRFGTVGIKFEDAMSGAIASAKLAKATLGDVDTIARSMAMTYRLLGETIDASLSPMQKQESLVGKVYHLWKTNAFEANEYAASLSNFVSTANVANFTTDQTIALLAALGTAGVQGSRGGALLKTSIFKLVENLDQLAGTLGLAVNPELETTFGLFMRVLGTINKLSQTTGIPRAAMESIREIFGGVRQAQAISALNAMLLELRKNLVDLGQDPQKFIKELNDRFEEVKNTVSGQLEIFRNLRAQIGEAFVKGVTGANDFKDSLIKINQDMEALITVAQNVGKFIRQLWIPDLVKDFIEEIGRGAEEFTNLVDRVEKARQGLLSLSEIMKLIATIQVTPGIEPFAEDWIRGLEQVAHAQVENVRIQDRINKIITDWNEKNIAQKEKERKKIEELSIVIQDRLALAQKDLNLQQMRLKGASDAVIEEKKLDDLVSTLVDRYNNLVDASGKHVQAISTEAVKARVLKGDFEGILELFKSMTLTDKELLSLLDQKINIEKALTAEKEKQKTAVESLYMTYEKATELDKERVRRLMELLMMKPEELASRFQKNMYDQNIIKEYWSSFNEQAKNAINKVLQEKYNLPRLNINAALAAKQGLGGGWGPFPGVAETRPTLNQIVGANIQTINVNLPEMDADELATEVGRRIAKKLEEDENFQELVANKIRAKV